jgi:hypothetical protein
MRESYVSFCINEIRVCLDELYKLMLDENKEDAVKKCKESIKLLRDIISDFDD